MSVMRTRCFTNSEGKIIRAFLERQREFPFSGYVTWEYVRDLVVTPDGKIILNNPTEALARAEVPQAFLDAFTDEELRL